MRLNVLSFPRGGVIGDGPAVRCIDHTLQAITPLAVVPLQRATGLSAPGV